MKDAELAYQIVQALQQTAEWDHLWIDDSSIQQAETQLKVVMERLKLPDQHMDDLWSAVYGLTSASENAAMLYGIRAMEAIREIAAYPEAITNKIMERRANVSRQV